MLQSFRRGCPPRLLASARHHDWVMKEVDSKRDLGSGCVRVGTVSPPVLSCRHISFVFSLRKTALRDQADLLGCLKFEKFLSYDLLGSYVDGIVDLGSIGRHSLSSTLCVHPSCTSLVFYRKCCRVFAFLVLTPVSLPVLPRSTTVSFKTVLEGLTSDRCSSGCPP